jgi:hypothetical protein
MVRLASGRCSRRFRGPHSINSSMNSCSNWDSGDPADRPTRRRSV